MLSLSDIVNVKVGIGRGVFEAPGATVIGGKKPSFNLEILKLFANGEQGFWYDPSDMGTMFQDSAGTTAINASGQPLGLVLDKSKGIKLIHITGFSYRRGYLFGPGSTSESLTPSASAVTTDWIPVSGNSFYEIRSDNSNRRMFQFKSLTGVVTYEEGQSGSYSVDGVILRTGADTAYVRVYFSSLSSDANLTITKIDGNHAYQTTSASRPILQDAPRRIDFDAVDDKLITNLPAQLTGCTVIRSVPGVGVQLLTNQTIPAAYEDNKDHCGLIVINRALTPSETSAIAAEFNKRAGV